MSELIETLKRHLKADPTPRVIDLSERLAERFRQEALDEWGDAQPMSYENESLYNHHIGPSHLMERVLSEVEKEEYEMLEREAPPLFDRQSLLGEFDPEELARMPDDEVLIRNMEALFFDALWDVWDHRFDGEVVVVVAHTKRNGIAYKRLVHPLTHTQITDARFSANGDNPP